MSKAIKEVKAFAESFCYRSVGCVLPEMCTDCYMNVTNWINAHKHLTDTDEQLKEFAKTALSSGWNWENDSISGQSVEVQDALEKFAERLEAI